MGDELDGLTAIDRLRLYVIDPDTFSFDINDAEDAVAKYDELAARADLVEPLVEALRRSREAVNAIVLSTHSVSFNADLRAIDAALQAYEAAR